MGKGLAVGLALGLLAMPPGVRAQADDTAAKSPSQAMDESGEKNAAKARAALDAMVKALGGDCVAEPEERGARRAHRGVLPRHIPMWVRRCSGNFMPGRITTGWSIRSIATWCSFT